MSSISPPFGPSERRAASAIVGLVLLFGMVMVGAGLILMASMSATDQVQQQNELDNAELSLQEASVRLQTLSYQDDDDVASFDLAGRNSDDVRIEPNGNLTFRLNGHRSCTATMEVSSIVYRNDKGQSVAYQAGGVWRDSGDGVSIVSPPDLTYQTDQVDSRAIRSLDFPVVNVQGDVNTASGEVTARQVDKSGGPSMEEQLCLPVSGNSTIDRVRSMTITLENNTYYEAWERYLDDEFGEEVLDKEVDHDNQTLRYTVPLGQALSPNEFTVDDAAILGGFYSGSAAGKINLKQDGIIDSYDGSQGTYESQPANWDEGNVYTNGNVTIKNSDVNGTIYSGNGVKLTGNYLVNGDVYFNNSTGSGLSASGGGTINGETDNGTHIPPLPDVDEEIEAALNTVADANHNNRTDVIENNQTNLSMGDTETLESPGVFYLDSLSVPKDSTLVLDTSNGDIVFAVEGNVDLPSGAEIRVHGDGQARMFVGGESGDQLRLDGSKVGVHNGSQYTNRSDGFWFYCKSGCSGEFLGGSEFTGVVYGPGNPGGKFGIGGETEVYGALAVDEIDTTAGNGGQGNEKVKLHFDTSVQNAEFDRDGDGTPDSEEGTSGGVPEEYDDCPDIDAMGVNGCQPVNEDETANALVVNQSHARLTVVGSMVADNRTRTREVGEREPLDVVFVIDDSGSMGDPLTRLGYDPNNVNYRLEDSEELDSSGWSHWESREDADYIPSGETVEVPDGETWKALECTRLTGNHCHAGVVDQFNSGEELTPEDYHLFQRYDIETEVVPGGQVWLVSNGGYADPEDAGSGPEWRYPGETISAENWTHYRAYEIGNDPRQRRVDAMQQFIGFLNETRGDRVGVVEFSDNYNYFDDARVVHDISAEGGEFDLANSSLDTISTGGTPMNDAIYRANQELLSGSNSEKVMVLLTDGQPDDESATRYEARQVADSISVQTVGLSGDTDEDLLEYIADETGGNYSQVDNSDQLNETFREIAGNVTERTNNVIEYKDTTVEVSINDESVTLSGNANDPTTATRPSRTINIADTLGVDEEQVEEYVGTMLSAEATTYDCANVSDTGDTQTHDSTTYDEVTCNGTEGTFDQIDNSTSDHEIYVDGEDVPDDSNFDAGWFKQQNFSQVIDEYENDTGTQLVDDGTGTFDLGENNAVMVVRTNSSNGDTDYVVLHFEAWNEGPWVVNGSDDGSSQVVGDDTYEPNPTDDNSYVISIDESTVELGNESNNNVVLPGDITGALTAEGALQGGGDGLPSAVFGPDARARPAA